MGRLLTSGFELNSATAGVEWVAANGTAGDPGVSVQGTTKRTGGYALKFKTTGSSISGNLSTYVPAAAAGRTYRARFYFQYHTLPNALADIAQLSADAISSGWRVRFSTSGTLGLFNKDDTTQVGSYSSALTADTWYRIEVAYAYDTGACSLRIDGTQTASGTLTSSFALAWFALGSLTPLTAGEWYIDDVAVNDDQGTSQNSWPGIGQVICLRPDSAGDANSFATQQGGTAGAGNNFGRVNEVTPDDATTYNGSATANEEDLYNCGASGLDANDVINVVHVNYRYRRSATGTGPTVKLECMKTTGGTKAQSTGIIPNSTTWKTNANANPLTSPLTLYKDPDNSVAWTQTTLDSMQIGMVCTQTTTPRCDVSTIWATVDYTPAVYRDFTGTSTCAISLSAAKLNLYDNFTGTATCAVSVSAPVLDTTGAATYQDFTGTATCAVSTSTPIVNLYNNFVGTATCETSLSAPVLNRYNDFAGTATCAISVGSPHANLYNNFTGTATCATSLSSAILNLGNDFTGVSTVQVLTNAPNLLSFYNFTGIAVCQADTSDPILNRYDDFTGVSACQISTSDPNLSLLGYQDFVGIATCALSTASPKLNLYNNFVGTATCEVLLSEAILGLYSAFTGGSARRPVEMILKRNTAGQYIFIYAHDTNADEPKTGDAGNITAYLIKDNGSAAQTNDINPTEVDSVNAPGTYRFTMTQAETNFDVGRLQSSSTTTNIFIAPVDISTVDTEFDAGLVWDELTSNHTATGSFGKVIGSLKSMYAWVRSA